jgi:hypothetical protein
MLKRHRQAVFTNIENFEAFKHVRSRSLAVLPTAREHVRFRALTRRR